MTLLLRALYTLLVSFTAAQAFAKLMFEQGQTSYNIAFIGLGLVLAPAFYNSISRAFGTRLIVVDSEKLTKELEEKLKQMSEDEK